MVPTLNRLKRSNQIYIKRNGLGEMTVDDKRVSEKDVRATDGVVHVIDEVMSVSTGIRWGYIPCFSFIDCSTFPLGT